MTTRGGPVHFTAVYPDLIATLQPRRTEQDVTNHHGIPLADITVGRRVQVESTDGTATATIVRLDSPTWGVIALDPDGERALFSAHNVTAILDGDGPA